MLSAARRQVLAIPPSREAVFRNSRSRLETCIVDPETRRYLIWRNVWPFYSRIHSESSGQTGRYPRLEPRSHKANYDAPCASRVTSGLFLNMYTPTRCCLRPNAAPLAIPGD